MCEQFFERMSHNYCVKAPSGEKENPFNGKMYCFVSSTCSSDNSLKGTQLVTDQVAEKGCTEADELLSDKSVEEIEALATKDNVDRGLMIKMAYDLFPGLK